MQHEKELAEEATSADDACVAISSDILIEDNLTLFLPLRYAGGDLGLSDCGEPWIYFRDAKNRKFLTHSIEWLLKNIDSFAEGRARIQPLACAASHYGLDPWSLCGRDQLCDVRTPSGKVLLADVSHGAASWACDEYMKREEWTTDIHIRFLGRFVPIIRDNPHDGPLILLNLGLHASDGKTVAIRSHIGRSSMTLEETLRRVDQFSHAHQEELLSDLRSRFKMDETSVAMAEATKKTLTILRRFRLQKTRPTGLW